MKYIDRLSEVSDGYVVVPGTNAKALNMESQVSAIGGGDFALDPVLCSMVATRSIEDYAVRSFKTFGTSGVWVHESEVTSYRYLVLGEIVAEDRWRARAWILDGPRLGECAIRR
jgi:hypothetical protein